MLVNDAIDAHVHVWTSDLIRYPLAAGFESSSTNPSSFTPDEFFQVAGQHAISRAVLIQMDFYGSDNSYMLDMTQRFPGRFSGVVQVDEERDPVAELQRLKSVGVRGVRLVSSRRGSPNWLDTPGTHALWNYGAANGIAMCLLMNPDDIPAVSRMCKLHPQTRVVIDHCARIQLNAPTAAADIQALSGLAEYACTNVKVSALYFLTQTPARYGEIATLVRQLMQSFGAERLMWGSDCPFQLLSPHSYREAFLTVAEKLDFVGSEGKQWLLRDTAAKVFFS